MGLGKEGANWINRALERLSSLPLEETDHIRVKALLKRIQSDQIPILGKPEERLESARIIADKMLNIHSNGLDKHHP